MDVRRAKTNLKVAVVCSSNMNRSMEAHAFLKKKGFNVDSYGTGDKVNIVFLVQELVVTIISQRKKKYPYRYG